MMEQDRVEKSMSSQAVGLARRPMDRRSPVQVELDRVGANFRKAGASGYVCVQLGIDEIKLLGPATRASAANVARP
jgi:hypothetical protein